jgi:ParB/RepB/Spo0J family partition protein
VVKRRGLGRGLDALLGAGDGGGIDTRDEGELRNLPVEFLQRGRYQPRMDFDPAALQELADSIKAQGVVQPIVARPIGEDRYEIIAGERRWRAAQLAGLAEIPALVRDIPDEAAIAVALIENIQRENLNPLEEATALKRLTEEFGLTHQDAANAVGRWRGCRTASSRQQRRSSSSVAFRSGRPKRWSSACWRSPRPGSHPGWIPISDACRRTSPSGSALPSASSTAPAATASW